MKSLSMRVGKLTAAVVVVVFTFAASASAQCLSTSCQGGLTLIDRVIASLQAMPQTFIIATLIELLVTIAIIAVLIAP